MKNSEQWTIGGGLIEDPMPGMAVQDLLIVRCASGSPLDMIGPAMDRAWNEAITNFPGCVGRRTSWSSFLLRVPWSITKDELAALMTRLPRAPKWAVVVTEVDNDYFHALRRLEGAVLDERSGWSGTARV